MTILLIGYYGYGNAGDEFLLQQTRQFLSDIIPREPVVWFSKLKTLLYIPRASFVVFGGGGLLQNATSNRSLYYYLSLIILSKVCRRPIVLLSQGIGPIHGKWANRLTGYALSLCSFISVRDVASFHYSQRFLTKTRQSIDLSFYKSSIRQSKSSSDVRLDETAEVFINIRSGPAWNVYSDVFQPLFDRLDYKTYVIAHDGVDVSLSQVSSGRDLLTLLSNSDRYCRSSVKAMISMRYHGCVWAIINNIPCLALAYDEKVVQLALQFNLPFIDLRKTYSSEHVTHFVTSFLKECSSNLRCELPFEDINCHFNEIQSLVLKEVLEL